MSQKRRERVTTLLGRRRKHDISMAQCPSVAYLHRGIVITTDSCLKENA